MKKLVLLFISIVFIVVVTGLVIYFNKPSKTIIPCGQEYVYQGIKHTKECDCDKKKAKEDLFGGTTVYCDGTCGECQCYISKFNSESEAYGEKELTICPIAVQ